MQQRDQIINKADKGTGPFISSPIEGQDLQEAWTRLLLDERHQGWRGLPHGGVLMSLILELAHKGLEDSAFLPERYPLHVSFRWGGTAIPLGQRAIVHVQQKADTIDGWIKEDKDALPALKATIGPGLSSPGIENKTFDKLAMIMESIDQEAKEKALPLPYSHSCFVCGTERDYPGLERKFYCLEGKEKQIVFTSLGLDPDDQNRLFRFRLEDDHDQIHPGVLAAVLDETLGWSGFLHTRQGGMTVKLEIDLLRPMEKEEKILSFGSCSGTRGNSPNRLFWFSEGGILPIGEEKLSPIMLARGQWLAVPRLTEEMEQQLVPKEWLKKWFG